MNDQLNKGGKTLADLAPALGAKVETASGFKRGASVAALGGNAVDGAFRLAKGESDRAAGDQPGEWIVYTLTDIATPTLDPNSTEAKTLREQLQRAQGDEQVAAYVARLETEIGVKINEQAFAVATGQTQPDNN